MKNNYWKNFCKSNKLNEGKTNLIPDTCKIPINLFEGVLNVTQSNNNIKIVTRKECFKGLIVTFSLYKTKNNLYFGTFIIGPIYLKHLSDRSDKPDILKLCDDPDFNKSIKLDYVENEIISNICFDKNVFNKNELLSKISKWFDIHFEKGWILRIEDLTIKL